MCVQKNTWEAFLTHYFQFEYKNVNFLNKCILSIATQAKVLVKEYFGWSLGIKELHKATTENVPMVFSQTCVYCVDDCQYTHPILAQYLKTRLF